jgi:hypothetical protein
MLSLRHLLSIAMPMVGSPPIAQLKAPHAYHGSMPRQRRGQRKSFVWSFAHQSMIPRVRLFKRHRP